MNGLSIVTMLRMKWPWLLACFLVVAVVSGLLLQALASPVFLSTGLVELGYFNPRDYQPHPVMSTRAVAALVGDPSFTDHVVTALTQGGDPRGEGLQLGSAPLEEGLLRVEARASTSRRAKNAAAVACSLVVGITGEDYRREKALLNAQLELVRNRSALAESLILESSTVPQRETLQGDALRALALFTEIQVEKEIEAELMRQKKPSRVVVRPGPGVEERPPVPAMALGPALVVTVLLAAGFLARQPRGGELKV